ncbi:MAG: hypothetical protein KQH79_13790 [Bacteroidetes bacterium]|nr:hypothetical protein [Bacteroidota bacterium]
MRILITLLGFVSFLNCALANNEGMPIIKNFKAVDYKGGSRIYSVVTTSDGLLYAGDKTGVLEFDGENWTKIECGFTVNSLAVDSNNVVYVAGSRGIGRLESDSTFNTNYVSMNHLIGSEKSLRKFRNSKVFNINQRIIYVLGNEIVINTAESIRIIESPYHFTYYQSLDNELYFYSEEEGFYQLVGNKLRLLNNSDNIKHKRVVGFLNYKKQVHALIANFGLYNLNKNEVGELKNLMSEINVNKIQGVDQIDDSTYALKTFYNGVILFNSKGQVIKKYHYDEGLVNNTVFSVFKDYWENLWIGTASGISAIRLNFPFYKYNNHHGIGTGYASVLYKNDLYFATSQGLYYSERDDQNHLIFKKLFDGHVWGLFIIDDILYFGSPAGIYAWNGKQINRSSYYPGGWNITQLASNKDFYVTGSPVGVVLLKKGKNKILQHVRIIKGLETNIRNIEIDNENTLWAEFDNGLYRFNLDQELQEVENLRSFDRIEANNKLKRIIKYEDQIYFLADSGIYLHHNEKGFYKDTVAFKSINNTNVIPSNIIIDDFNRWWTFSNGDLSCYAFADNQLKKLHLSLSDYGSETYPIDFENVFSLDSNYVIIGQEEGFLGYKLIQDFHGTYSANRVRKIILTTRKGKVTRVKGEEKIVNWTQYGKITKKLPYGSSIKFYYSAGCSNYNLVKYATFLFGFDEKWPEWNNETIKEYTNLPQGKYKFIVRSINKSNEESTLAIYEFEVSPPWYFTWIAKVAYGILIIIVIVIVKITVTKRTQKFKSKIQKEQEEISFRKQQAQIQENLKKQQEIIKLRNEKLRIDNLYKSKELANSTMSVIKKNQFLTELKEELQTIKTYADNNKLVSGDIKNVIRKINRDIDNEENWKVFEDYFDRVHEKFLNRLKTKYPILTAKDLRLGAYLRMNLTTKEIAPLMNISVRGVEISRYRLRRKLELDRNDNLNDFLLKF